MKQYAEYASAQVALRDAYKNSLEQRATGVVTAATGLSTLLLGVLTFARASGWRTPDVAYGLTVLAVLCLGAAVVVAIFVLSPRRYLGVKPTGVRDAVKRRSDTDEVAFSNIANTELDVLDAAIAENEKKASLLWWGFHLQAAATGSVALAVVTTLMAPS